MIDTSIAVRGLTKVYRVPIKDPGLMGSLRSLIARKHREVRAVDEIDFDIEPGERIGFLGPNGAGKTTTLKMLTGLLHPTAGSVRVAGHEPKRRPNELLRQITLVMGQKQQLVWDLPPLETFALNRALYDIDRAQYRETLDELIALLEIGEVVERPTRNLSLGQRMRCELCASLLHRPRILFLDEPTIGMDVQVQALVRKFVRQYADRYGATVMLTSHDMNDVAQIAERILLIDKGKLRFDGSLAELSHRFGAGRQLLARASVDLSDLGFAKDDHGRWVATVQPAGVNPLLSAVLARAPHAEVTVADPPLDEVLARAFGGEE